ncbi:MAG: transcriptional regulator, IclR family [Acidimicrobiaceae bacterium]|nr:transcriptional regulator, IclR family [Acidimicrobiaceae bacterium]
MTSKATAAAAPKSGGAARAHPQPVELEEESSSSSAARSVERVCDIFDRLQDAPSGLTLTDLAEKTGLAKSTAYRYVIGLASRDYVERDADSNLVRLGRAFHPKPERRIDEFVAMARPLMELAAEQSEETLNLGMLDGSQYVHVLVIESSQIMRLAARVGEHGLIHSTAIGKVIATQMSEESLTSILQSEGLPSFTKRTITSLDVFRQEITRVRRQGFALDDCENQEDGRCIAVPVSGPPIPMGISISAPVRRFPKGRVPEFANLLLRTAEMLEAEYREIHH